MNGLNVSLISATVIIWTTTEYRVCSLSIDLDELFVMRCAIWYYLYNFKNVKNTHGGVLILERLQAKACNFTKINIPP